MPEPASDRKSVFGRALELAPVERAAYLDVACAEQPILRAEVEDLLRAHGVAGSFLNSQPAAPAAEAATVSLPGGKSESTQSLNLPVGHEGRIVAGRYKLLQTIGEGGMGTVWMADQTEPVKRRVAVKLIRVERGSSKTILSRFEAERQAIALMSHPNIAKLLDAGTAEDGAPFFVMELVKGVPLTEYCDAHKLSVTERLQLFRQICSAVHHAHQKGIIHRDLKPTNILVESHDGKPVPKVIDFGLAKATTGMQLTEHTLFTGFGTVMGTPLYMAPEQATFNALDVDSRADIYALGVILYELLAGSTPIQKDTLKVAALDEMLRVIREQEPPPPSSRIGSSESKPSIAANRQSEPIKLGRFVRGDLDWIVMKALAKERDRRYESATAMATDVDRFLTHEPVSAGPPSQWYQLRKFLRRNKGRVAAALLVLVVLLAGVIGTSFGLIESKKATARAQVEEIKALSERDEKVKALEAETVARQDVTVARDRLTTSLVAERRTAYDMTIPEVQRAYRDNDLNRARTLLASCPEDLRGFEWNLLNREFDRGAITIRPALTRDTGGPRSRYGITGDGKSIVAVTPNTVGLTIQTWELATGNPAPRIEIKNPSELGPWWGSQTRLTVSEDWTRVALWRSSPSNLPPTLVDGMFLHENGLLGSISSATQRVRPVSTPPPANRPPIVFVYDLSTGKQVTRLEGHPHWVSGVAFGPGKRQIATGCEDRGIRIWDSSGHMVRVLTGHTAQWAEPLAITPDGKSLVSVGAREDVKKDGVGRRELRVWDLTTGAARVEGEISGVWFRHDESPLRFTPDGRYAVGIDPLRPVIDLSTGKEAVTVPRGSIATGFTNSGTEVVVMTYPGIVTRVRLDTGATAGMYRLPWDALDGAYSYPTLNRDGTALACLSPNMSVSVTDPRTGFELRTVPTGVRQFSGDSHRLVLDPNGSRVLVHNLVDHEVKLWDVTARSSASTLASLHEGINWAVAFSPDAKTATCISQSRLRDLGENAKPIDQVDLINGRRVERDRPIPFRSVLDLCYSPDGKRVGGLFYGSFTSPVNPLQRITRYTAVVLDIATGAHTVGNTYVVVAEESWSNRGTRQPTPRMTCSADGTFLVAYAKADKKEAGVSQIWQIEDFGTGRVRFTFPTTSGRTFVPASGGKLAALFSDKPGVPAIEVWDLELGAKLPWSNDTKELRTGVESGVFSGDGRRLLTLSEANSDGNESHFNRGPRQPKATVWDVRTGTSICTFAPPIGVTAQWAIFSPDGERLLFYTGLAQRNILALWNATTGRELISKLETEIHTHGGAFTPDGRLILEVQNDLNRGFKDSRIQVWNGTASGTVWRPAPTADSWLEEIDRLMSSGRPAEAVPLCQKAVDAYPTSEATLSALGLALLRSGRMNDAISVLKRCIECGEPNGFGGKRLRSAEHYLLALACQQAGNPEEARTWFDTGEKLIRTFHSFQNSRAGSVFYPTTPSAERARSEPVRAEAAAAMGITLRPLPPLDPAERMDWATDAVKKGDHALGTRTADEIVATTRFVAILYNAACLHSLAVASTSDETLRKKYADRAIVLLNEAVAAKLGDYFRAFGVNAVEHLKKDSDLDPIRTRDDFKRLIAELEKKDKPMEQASPQRK